MKEFPEINFFGLLVGPRGNSLKKMEKESGAKISIRGKGSVKEGKGRPDAYADDAEEDLHCLVMGDSQDKVNHCVRLINRVIETVCTSFFLFSCSLNNNRSLQAASTPEGQNDHKRNQLRELAALNGTLRDDENQICQNCGGVGHRKYDCTEQRNFTANIICRTCGNAGHMARDCMQRNNPNGFFPGPGAPGGPATAPTSNALTHGPGSSNFDNDLDNLLNELGEKSAGGDAAPWARESTLAGDTSGSNIPPWRRPEVWLQASGGQRQQQQQQQQQGYSAYPQGYGGYPGYNGATNPWQQGAAGYNPQQSYAAYYQTANGGH